MIRTFEYCTALGQNSSKNYVYNQSVFVFDSRYTFQKLLETMRNLQKEKKKI